MREELSKVLCYLTTAFRRRKGPLEEPFGSTGRKRFAPRHDFSKAGSIPSHKR